MFSIQRIALLLQYNGSGFQGSQSQQPCVLPEPVNTKVYPVTVQATLNQAFEALGFPPVKGMFAGRTDKGVHALGQVAHVDCCAETLRRFPALIHSLNAKLPPAIRILETVKVSPEFHAQQRAIQKWYRYGLISRTDRTHTLKRLSDPNFVHYTRDPFYSELLQGILECLLGSHDFSSFARPKHTVRSPICELRKVQVSQPYPYEHPDYWVIDFVGDRFLYGMVRLIVGLALKIAAGKLAPRVMEEVLLAGSFATRMRYAPIACPEGLCLMAVEYLPPYNTLFSLHGLGQLP